MAATRAIFARELRGYFTTSIGYVLLVIFLVLASLLTLKGRFFEMRQADLRAFFDPLPQLLLFFAPAVGMRLWAEEKKSGTIELLFTQPVTVIQAVCGKFFAAWFFLFLALVLTTPVAMAAFYLGDPDAFVILAGYAGALLTGGGYLAVSMFCSALTRSQIVSVVLSISILSLFAYADSPALLAYLARLLPPFLIEAVANLSFVGHFESMRRGVLEFGDLAFFLVATTGLIAATCVVVDAKRDSC